MATLYVYHAAMLKYYGNIVLFCEDMNLLTHLVVETAGG